MSRHYLVKGVAGQMFLDPQTIGSGQRRFVGHKQVVKGTRVDPRVNPDPKTGQTVPNVQWEFVPDHDAELVAETSDHHVRKTILENADKGTAALEYVATVDFYGTPAEKKHREPDLVRATVVNGRKRAENEKAAQRATVDAESIAKEALEAAEQGLTLDEARLLKAEADAKMKATQSSSEATVTSAPQLPAHESAAESATESPSPADTTSKSSS